MEYFPEAVLQSMQLCENALRETVRAGQLVHFVELRGSILSIKQALFTDCEESAKGSHIIDMTYHEWLCRIVDLLDRSCTGTEVNTTSTGLSSLLGVSFEMNTSAAQAFHQVANLLCFKCFLFESRVNYVSFLTKSEGNMIFLEKISTVFHKWKEVDDNEILKRWTECEFRNSEPVKEILYQWTHTLLEYVTNVVNEKMTMMKMEGSYFEAARLGGEYIDFLEEHNTCLDPDDTEFLYTEFLGFYTDTALLRFNLGKFEQAQELYDKLLRLFDNLEDARGAVKIPKWLEGKVVYTQPGVETIIMRRIPTLENMIRTLQEQSKNSDVYKDKLKENRMLRSGDDIPEYSPESFQYTDSQLTEMKSLIQAGRYSEAEKVFESGYKEEIASLDRRSQRFRGVHHWLEVSCKGLSSEDYPQCLDYSSSEWQAHCRKFELVLDMTELARDPILSAEIMRRYGNLIAERSMHLYKMKVKWGEAANTANSSPASDHVDNLERWLKEELGLPMEGEQEVALFSCFSEPCCRDEHKKLLPPMLKSYRLLKCSIDNYSLLLHKWTKESADETGWLQLLESQKFFHAQLQEIVLHISEYCLQFIELGNKLRRNSSTHDVFQKMYDACALSSLVWAERSRARSLLHQLAPAYAGLSDHVNLQSIREQLVSFDLDEKRAFSDIMSCNESCEGAVFVEYVLSHYTPAAFVTYGGPYLDGKFVRVQTQWVQFKCDEEKVKELVEDFHKAVNPNDKGKVEYDEHLVAGYLEKLFKMLIKPIWPLISQGLRPNSTLVFVPDKILHRVPFALLRHPKSQKYLFELHPISVAPSLRVLYHCKRRLSYLESCPLKPGKSVVAVGDASYTNTQRLPRSGEEVTKLAERFPGLVYKLEKCDATCANLLALLEESSMSNEKHEFALMHLGVHCNWSSNFKTGAIQFAKSSQADNSCKLGSVAGAPNVASTSRDLERLESVYGEVGAITRDSSFKPSSRYGDETLRSEDIIANGLQWPTRLVVLSACNSSNGQVFGDGEVNLPRALMIAGVPASLVAQWKVLDDASPDLMDEFYDSLQRGQDVANALQSSMLHALRGKYKYNSASKIHEWGPFVIWGLPSVQLPKTLWKQDALDQSALRDIGDLASTGDGCNSENSSGMYDVIVAALKLRASFRLLSESVVKTIEQVFITMPSEHLRKAEMQLEASEPELLSGFRDLMRFAQAIRGNFQESFDYANALIADQTVPYQEYHRQERAVVLRLLGRYEESVKEFDKLLEPGFDYECQMERSCVKYLMGDKDGALEDARHAQRMRPQPDRLTPIMLLSLHAMPLEFREWISTVCITAHLCNDLLDQRAQRGISGIEREAIMSDVSEAQHLLASTNDGCTSENSSGMYDDIVAALKLCERVRSQFVRTLKLIEQVFITRPPEHFRKVFITLPPEHLRKAGMELEASEPELLFEFRAFRSFAQAIRGNFQESFDYASALIADHFAPFRRYHRQERAVVLRLLGRYEETVKGFDKLLAFGFDYECQMERSCVMYLIGDKDEALEDARHAQEKRHQPEQLTPLTLSLYAKPLEFREWISTVCITVDLCDDYLDQRALLGISGYEREVVISDVFVVEHFLASTADGCTSENSSGMYDVIVAALKLRKGVRSHFVSVVKTIEQVFITMPLEHLCKAEMQLEASEPELLFEFRDLMRFALAMRGNFQESFDYASALIADHFAPFRKYHRRERAVILRLLGRYEESVKEFDKLLAFGFLYECQMERSCVKYLMGDKDGALEDARHAQEKRYRPEQWTPFTLSLHVMPLEFREWVSTVCITAHLCDDPQFSALASSSTSVFTGDGM